MKNFSLFACFLLSGCGAHFSSLGEESRQRDLAFNAVELELGDLRHALQAQRTNLALMQERLQEQESLLEQVGKEHAHTQPLMARLASLERQHERILNDVVSLKNLYEQSGRSTRNIQEEISSLHLQIDQCLSKLGDIHQLKSTLTQVSRAITEKTNPSWGSNRRYRVKQGDTLDKIAKEQRISVAEIKRLNNLQSDKILFGQELIFNNDE